MPLYVMIGRDKPDSLELRLATRPSHLDWIRSLGDRVKVAGPLQKTDGAPPSGSLIVIEAESLEVAQNVFAQDPYALAGLWGQQSIEPFTWVKL